MLRTIKLFILAIIMIMLILVGVANRDPIVVKLLPDGLAGLVPFPTVTPELPLYAIIAVAIAVGLLLGYIIEYLRESKHRRMAAAKAREASHLKNQVRDLQRKTGEGEDDVLALLN